MLNNIRAQLKLFFGVLKHAEDEAAIIVRRDAGIIHDQLLQLEVNAGVISVAALHELKKLFSPSTPKEVVEEVEGLIKHIDGLRKLQKLPPSGPQPTPVAEPPVSVPPNEGVKAAEAPAPEAVVEVAPPAAAAEVVPFPSEAPQK